MYVQAWYIVQGSSAHTFTMYDVHVHIYTAMYKYAFSMYVSTQGTKRYVVLCTRTMYLCIDYIVELLVHRTIVHIIVHHTLYQIVLCTYNR